MRPFCITGWTASSGPRRVADPAGVPPLQEQQAAAPDLARGSLLRRSVFPAVVLLALGLAAWRMLDMGHLSGALLRARPWPLAALLACHLASTLLHALRLRLLLDGSVNFALAFHANNICNLVNSILPLRAGEFAMALIVSRRAGVSGGEVLSYVLVDRLLAILMVLLMFLCALPFAGGQAALPDWRHGGALPLLAIPALVLALYGLTRLERRVLGLFGWLLALLPVGSEQAKGTVLRRLGDVISGLRVMFRPRVSLPVCAVCLASWGCISALNYFGMLAVISEPPVVASVFLTFFTIVGIMLVATPSGAGTVHGVTVLTLALFGVRAEEALAIGILVHALVTAANVALGLASARAMRFRIGSLWGPGAGGSARG